MKPKWKWDNWTQVLADKFVFALAKNGMDIVVFGQNEIFVHKAMFYNYLGISEMTGDDFLEIARKQVIGFGAKIEDVNVTSVEKTGSGFAVTTEGGDHHEGKYLVLATGTNTQDAESLRLTKTRNGIEADEDGRTSVNGLFTVFLRCSGVRG